MKVKVYEETFGITRKSLKALRDELAGRIDHILSVWELPAEDTQAECYGLCIVDLTVDEAVIIGDGFRRDGGGEGGAGHRAALALLSIFGFSGLLLGRGPTSEFSHRSTDYYWRNVVAKVSYNETKVLTRDRTPYYIDSVCRK